MSSPILALPDFSLDFVLGTDASGDGLGAVLSQVTNGEERVLAYASRGLSRSERMYCDCATRQEMLVLVWAVTKNLVRGKNRSGLTNFGDQKWFGRTEYDAKICPVNPKLVQAHKYLVQVEISLILCENGLFK